MRFEELTLERYGAFEARAMAFGPGLTVVYGPNEAGKSTSLAAVGDFLFGVPARSARGAVFGNDVLRLGATLIRADGMRLSLRRRKGNARTLSDADGAAVDEGVLAALLGATTRERFDTLFGLDHERLRRGGERLLAADGEIGRLIVEAGGGLRTLVDRLKAIDGALDKLFAPRKGAERAYYKALDAFEAADRDVKAGLLTREAYEKSKAAHSEAEAAVARLREARRELVQRASGLERMARVIPLIGALDRIVESQAAFGDLPPLPDAFDADVAAAGAAKRDAARVLGEAEANAEALAARLASVVVDAALVTAEARVRDADERRVVVANARGDRPNRLRELAQAETRLEGLRRLVGAGPDDDLTPMLPAPEAVEAVRLLAAAAQARAPKLAAARSQIGELESQLGRLDARLAAAVSRGFDRASGVIAADLAGLPAMAAAAAGRAKAADAASERAAASARALGFADAASVRAFRCPDAETMARTLERDGRLAERRQAHLDARAAAEARRDAAVAEIARLQAGGEVATDAALAGARGARDAAWAPVRKAHAEGEADPDAARRLSQVRAVDDALSAADALADRRTGEAQRVAALAQAERESDGAVASHAAATAAIAEIDLSAAALKTELADAFPDAVARAPGLLALKTLSDERRGVLADADAAAVARTEAEAALAALDAPLSALAFAERASGLSAVPNASVGDRVRVALAAAGAHDSAHVEHRRDLREREDADAALRRAIAVLAELKREDDVWRSAWAPALKRLGLGEATSSDDAGIAAHEWAGARGVLEAIATARRRLKRMDDDEADLARRVAEIGAAARLALPEDPVAAAKMLHDRFRANDEARGRRETLAPGVDEAARTIVLRRQELDTRDAALAALAAAAGLAGDALNSLGDIAARHAARRALRDDESRARASVVAAGDGRAVDALREAVADRDLDAVTADLAAAQAETEQLEHALDQAIRAEHEAAAVLAGHSDAAGVNRAVVLRESATAELHDVVERYVELSLARDLVEAAIARVRAEQQDPLVTRAGSLFAQVTQGAFSGVAADVDDKGEPVVVGVRAGGGAVGASAMSDGTRDQLFLAFRLASLEGYCRAAEPLPFVADDVLVHFDDARGRATLELLADFGAVTQVLLFTHHRSVRAMAEELAAAGRCAVVDLG